MFKGTFPASIWEGHPSGCRSRSRACFHLGRAASKLNELPHQLALKACTHKFRLIPTKHDKKVRFNHVHSVPKLNAVNPSWKKRTSLRLNFRALSKSHSDGTAKLHVGPFLQHVVSLCYIYVSFAFRTRFRFSQNVHPFSPQSEQEFKFNKLTWEFHHHMRLNLGFNRQTLEFSDRTMELCHQAARGLYILYLKCVISIMNHASHHQNATAWHLPSIFSGQAIHAALHQGGHLYRKSSQGGVKPFTTVPRSKGKVGHPFVGVRVRYTFQSMEWWPSTSMVYNRYNPWHTCGDFARKTYFLCKFPCLHSLIVRKNWVERVYSKIVYHMMGSRKWSPKLGNWLQPTNLGFGQDGDYHEIQSSQRGPGGLPSKIQR